MTQDSHTWHYGIVAQWWAEFNLDGPEIACFQQIIEQSGQPALDAACGTGRLLLPFLRAGLDVDGCDISPDMLAYCRDNAAREGFAPHLYPQPLYELDLPRTYKTIIVCGGVGLGGNRAHDMQAFRRFYQHLQPGGVLAFDTYVPYAEYMGNWRYWTEEGRAGLPEEPDPPVPPDRRGAVSDGSALALHTWVVSLDPLEQVVTLGMRAERWRDDQRVEVEEYTLKEVLYFKNELLVMLELAGFVDVEVRGGYSDAPATGEDKIVLFVARK